MTVTHEKLRSALVLTVGATLLLTSCSAAAPEPQVETIEPSLSTSAAPTTAPTPVAKPGTRDAPLAIGEKLRLSSESMWTVGASAPTKVGAGYVALPLHLELDWNAIGAQGIPDGEGADPSLSLFIEYVTAGGRSYDIDETYVDVPNQLYQIGTLYPPASSVEANYVVTLPDAEIPNGVWKVGNSRGENVFLAAN